MTILYALSGPLGKDNIAERIVEAGLDASVWDGYGATSEYGVEATVFVEFATKNVLRTDEFIAGLLKIGGQESALRVVNREADASLLLASGNAIPL